MLFYITSNNIYFYVSYQNLPSAPGLFFSVTLNSLFSSCGIHMVVLFPPLHIKAQFSSNHISAGLLSASIKICLQKQHCGLPPAAGESTTVTCDSQSNLKVVTPRPFNWPHAEPWLDTHSWKPDRSKHPSGIMTNPRRLKKKRVNCGIIRNS